MAGKDAYRPDIDGVRALAVIAVVVFHAFPQALPGGFIGVDIFFVISGFLITTILTTELERGTFRYATFIGRRARRILPALCLVLAASAIAGWLLLGDTELVELGKQLVAGSLFFSNWLYWAQDGYFDAASELKPLVHLWSLAVEEQYYLIYPVILWAALRALRPGRLLQVLVGLFAGSFLFSLWATRHLPAAAFFLLPARFWQLLCGGLVALVIRRQSAGRPTLIHHALSVLGVAGMTAGIIWAQRAQFPGWWAVFPTLGAACTIGAGPGGVLNRWVFSWRPVVVVGLISYPLYLWHWPIISFQYIYGGTRPTDAPLLYGLVAAVVLSLVTYVVVEQPIRAWPAARALRILAPLVVPLAIVGALAVQQKGFATRSVAQLVVNRGEIDHEQFHRRVDEQYFRCETPGLLDHALDFGGVPRCHQSRHGTRYDVVLLGDSHAEHLFYGLASLLPEKNVVYAIVTSESADHVYQTLLKPREGRADLILVYQWASVLSLTDTSDVEPYRALVSRFQRAGYRVFLTDDVPAFSFNPSVCKWRRPLEVSAHRCREQSPEMDAATQRAQRGVQEIASATGATVLHTRDFFRERDAYFMARDGLLLYRDSSHLSLNGSLFVAQQLLRTGQLEQLKQ